LVNELSTFRKIHIDIPRAVHQRLRVKAALEDVSLQALVARLLSEAVVDVQLPQTRVAEPAPVSYKRRKGHL
jgi:hypothetical protein